MTRNFFTSSLFIIILAILVRLIHLNSSFWLDEAAQALESRRPLTQQLDLTFDFQPPLYHLIVHGFLYFSQSEVWLRLTSLIPGLISVWLTLKIGEKLFNREVGLTAAVLLATSQFHAFYSQELRPYSLATCLALAAFWYWYQLVTSSPKFSLGFFLTSLAGLYTMYLFPVFLLSLLIITFIFYRQKFLSLISYFVFLIIGFLPWLPSFINQLHAGTTFAATKPLWANIVSPPILKMLPLVYLKFIFGRIAVDPTPITLVIISLVIIALLIVFARLIISQSGKLIFLMLLLPPLLAFIISFLVPVLEPKRVLFSLPFLYLFIAAGLKHQLKDALILILFLSLNVSALNQYATNPDNQREPWREAIATLERDAPENTHVIFAFDAPFAPWVWYQRRNLPTLAITDPNNFPQLKLPFVATFVYLHELYDPHNQINQHLINQGYAPTGFYQYPGIGKINVYAR